MATEVIDELSSKVCDAERRFAVVCDAYVQTEAAFNKAHFEYTSMQLVYTQLAAKLAARKLLDRFGLRIVIATVSPIFCFGMVIIPSHYFFQSWKVAIPIAILASVVTAISLFVVLYQHSDSQLTADSNFKELQLNEYQPKYDAALSGFSHAKHDKQTVETELRQLQARLTEEKLRANWEFQAARLVAEPWRDLRGIPFEMFLKRVFLHLGYRVRETAATGDQGVDLLIDGGELSIAIQAKGYEGTVGNSAVQEVFSGMYFYKCSKCAVVTNSEFSKSARELAGSHGCVLIDGLRIPDLVYGKCFPRLHK